MFTPSRRAAWLRVLFFPVLGLILVTTPAVPLPAQRMRQPRVQEPLGPVPYRVETVRFAHREAGIELEGTLTLPEGPGPHPGVVLVTGQGPQDRDETILGHKPYLVLADRLTRRGVAVLRYDDRGVGRSTGDFDAATTMDFAQDAAVAWRFLAARPELDAGRVGLLGHSEGGLMVARAARDLESRPAFVVLLASPGLPGEEFYLEQDATESRRRGVDEGAIKLRGERKREMFAVLRAEPDPRRGAEKLRAAMLAMELTEPERAEIAAAGVRIEELIEQQIAQLNTRWHRHFLNQDPATVLRELRMPVLAMVGGRDVQVPPHASLPAIRSALATGVCPSIEVIELPGLNHLFQTCTTGLPDEYAGIDETIAPVALEAICAWIEKSSGAR